jgi:hypothetical protein
MSVSTGTAVAATAAAIGVGLLGYGAWRLYKRRANQAPVTHLVTVNDVSHVGVNDITNVVKLDEVNDEVETNLNTSSDDDA